MRIILVVISIFYSLYFIVSEDEELVEKDENSGVGWFGIHKFTNEYFDDHDVYLYNKLIQRALQI